MIKSQKSFRVRVTSNKSKDSKRFKGKNYKSLFLQNQKAEKKVVSDLCHPFSLLISESDHSLQIHQRNSQKDEGRVYQSKFEIKNLEKLKQVSTLHMENLECVICYSNPKNVIFKNCHHMIICKECYLQLPKKQCPFCKVKIKEIITIYAKQKSNVKQKVDEK